MRLARQYGAIRVGEKWQSVIHPAGTGAKAPAGKPLPVITITRKGRRQSPLYPGRSRSLHGVIASWLHTREPAVKKEKHHGEA